MPLMRRIIYFFIVLIMCGIFGCSEEKHYDAVFCDTPENFSILNTSYNDYNSNIGPGRRVQITFSSDRNGGDNYDFVVKRIDMEYLTAEGELYMQLVTYDSETVMIPIVNAVNTSANEFGPHSITDGEDLWFFYANDANGDLDIKYVVCEDENYEQSYYTDQSISEVKMLERINTENNEAYPCLHNNDLYFCSDANGDYDIVYAHIDEQFGEWLLEEDSTVIEIPEGVNSEWDDKCPFILGEMMVFASDREGGYGGFDLYYCLLGEDGLWSEPVNFGSDINSSADEYRPVVAAFDDFENDLMVFSSNREGGQGGFDLYYVGISKMINLQR